MYHAARVLSASDDVTLCTLYGTERERDSLEAWSADRRVELVAVRQSGSRIGALARGLLTDSPLHVARFRNSELRRRIGGLLATGRFDMVWCHFLYAASNIPMSPTPMVLDQHNLDEFIWSGVAKRATSLPARLVGRWNTWAWRRYQPSGLGRFRWILSVAAEEEAATRSLVGNDTKVLLAPNGVPEAEPVTPEAVSAGAPTIVFCASFHVFMNEQAAEWFARDIFPRIRAEVGNAELLLVGGRPGSRVRDLARAEGITVTGWVEDLRSYYARATVAIVPATFGGGTKLKTLEAMNLGVPVVATSVGAQGLDVAHGEELLIADDAEAFARHVVALLQSPERRAALAAAARKRVRERYVWDRIYAEAREAVAGAIA